MPADRIGDRVPTSPVTRRRRLRRRSTSTAPRRPPPCRRFPTGRTATVNLTLTATDNLSGVASTQLHGRRWLDADAVPRSSSRPRACTRCSSGAPTSAGNVEATHTADGEDRHSTAPIDHRDAGAGPRTAPGGTTPTSPSRSRAAMPTPASRRARRPRRSRRKARARRSTGHAVDNAGNTAVGDRDAEHRQDPADDPRRRCRPPTRTVGTTCRSRSTGRAATRSPGVASCPNPTHAVVRRRSAQSVDGHRDRHRRQLRRARRSAASTSTRPRPTLTASAPATATPAGTPGPVTVHWTCSDNLSGVVTCPADQTVTAEGVTTLAQTITDKAGNRTTNVDHDPHRQDPADRSSVPPPPRRTATGGTTPT